MGSVFVDQRMEINQKVYPCDILEAVVLYWAQQDFVDAIGGFSMTQRPFTRQK